jgi:hypothetical protein
MQDPTLEREARRAKLMVSRETMFAALETTLSPAQKEVFAALKTRFLTRRATPNALQPARVYVMEKEPVAKNIRIGISDGAFTQVEGEVKEGDKIIIGGGPKAEAQADGPRPPRMF